MYEDVFRELYKNKVRYIVVGGIAVNLYGVPRMTADLDLMVDLEKENVLKTVNILRSLGYVPKIPENPENLANREKREEWKKKNMKAFTFWNTKKPYKQIDIFIENIIDFDKAYNRREKVKAEGFEIYLASIDDLIEMKRKSGRKQDLCDIEALRKVKDLRTM